MVELLETTRAELVAVTAERDELQSKCRESTRKHLLSAMAKPQTFEGRSAGLNSSKHSVRDWVDSVKRYIDSAGFVGAEAVQFASSFLRDEALRTWNTRAAALLAEQHIATIDDFCECMIKRFEPASTEAAARVALDGLKQQGKFARLAAYLTEFERLCSFIPQMQQGEKVHRFLTGLQTPAYQKHLSVNPLTHTRYELFADLRLAAESLAVAAPGLINDILDRAKGKRGNGSMQGGGSGNSSSSKQPRQSVPDAGMDAKGPGGASVHRSKAIVELCRQKGLCLFCYGKGHLSRNCKAAQPAKGSPPA